MLLTATKTPLLLSLIRSNKPHLLHSTSEIQHPCHYYYTHLLKFYPKTRSTEQIHARIIVEGSCGRSFLATHLVKSYAKEGHHSAARRIFESVPNKTIFLWNAMIRACSQIGSWSEIAELYRRMESEEIQPDDFTLPFVIKAFSAVLFVEDGKRIHELANRIGLVRNVHIATALIDMHLHFNEIGPARDIFDRMPERDVVAWTAMISGCVRLGYHSEALRIFREMRLGDEKPNSVTVLSLISACGFSIHALIIKSGLGFSVEVETAILDMYAKGGDLAIARSLFDSMSQKSMVSWSAMIDGYSENKFPQEAISLFHQMLKFPDLNPDAIVTISVIQACAQLGSLNCGEMIHGYVIQHGFESELLVDTALVDMYAKCGYIRAAQMVFNRIQDPSMVTWSAMIAGYGFHGLGSKSLDLFEEMKREGFVPDGTAFLSILSACSHSGLIHEGREFFNSMVQMHGMMVNVKHYACMVDLLGRGGLIDEACGLIEGMPVEPDAIIWGALLSACRVKANVRAAELACQKLFELGADNDDYHVLMANVYAGFGRWDEVSNVRSVMRRQGEGKTPGCSFVELNCRMHAFVAGDRSHPQSKDVYAMLEIIHACSNQSCHFDGWQLAS